MGSPFKGRESFAQNLGGGSLRSGELGSARAKKASYLGERI